MSCSSAAARSASISFSGEVQFFGDLDREDAHALQVFVRGVVLRFDGQRQSFDGPQVQRRNIFGMSFFDFDLFLFRRQLAR